jgi:secreted trypsin-like serine protease
LWREKLNKNIYMYFLFVLLLQGDTAGLLTTTNCPRKLVGTVSFGEWNCGNPSYPTVYTKVSAVRDWIVHQRSDYKVPKEITKADAIP